MRDQRRPDSMLFSECSPLFARPNADVMWRPGSPVATVEMEIPHTKTRDLKVLAEFVFKYRPAGAYYTEKGSLHSLEAQVSSRNT
jgi:hypothetical protein